MRWWPRRFPASTRMCLCGQPGTRLVGVVQAKPPNNLIYACDAHAGTPATAAWVQYRATGQWPTTTSDEQENA